MIDKFKKGKHVYTHWDKKSEQVTVVPKKKKKVQETSITVEVPREVLNGVRANVFVINYTKEEVIIDFVFLPPQQKNARIVSRIVMSPRQAKQLLRLLERKAAHG